MNEALENIEQGGLAEAIVRMLVLLGNSRGDIRADRLQRSSDMLAKKTRPLMTLANLPAPK